MPSSPGGRGASAPIGRPSRTASRGRALGGVAGRFTGVTTLFGLGFGFAFDADLGFGFGCATRGGVNVARGAGVVACAIGPGSPGRRCRVAAGGRWRPRTRRGIGRGKRCPLRRSRGRRGRRCGDRGIRRRHGRGGLRDPLRRGRRARGRAARGLDGRGLVRRWRVVGRRHRRATRRPAVGRAAEGDQTDPGAEYPTFEPQRRRPRGHSVPSLSSLTVRPRAHACQRRAGAAAGGSGGRPARHDSTLLLLLHPSLDRAAPRPSALVVPRALARHLQRVRAVARLALHQPLAGLVEVEGRGERRDLVGLLDRAAAARATFPDRGVLVRRAELERRRACVGILLAPRALARHLQVGAAMASTRL